MFCKSPVFASWTDGTIDSVYKYAWSENAGWINFGTTNGNVHVTDAGLSGYALGENIGWIYLGDITNNGEGTLSGYGWGENVGWIKFNPTNGGVIINSSGEFTGSALGEDIGWIIFGGDYKVKTDWRPISARTTTVVAVSPGGGGGGLSFYAPTTPTIPTTYAPTTPTSGGFSVSIQGGARYTNNRTVILKLNGGANAKNMAISDSADFSAAGKEPYETRKTWTFPDHDGPKTIYAQFYTASGQPSISQIVSDTIILDTKPPQIKITESKDSYSAAENIALTAETEPNVEVVLGWDQKYGLIHADERGNLTIDLGQMSAGSYQLKLTPTDLAGNKGNTLMVNLAVKPIAEKMPEVTPQATPKKPIIEKAPGILTPLIQKPEEMIVIPKTAPLAMRGQRKLLPQEQISEFVLVPLPKAIENLAQKFQGLEKTFEEVGISKITDIEKLQTVKLTLPGLTEMVSLSATEQFGEFAKLTQPEGMPIVNELEFAKLVPPGMSIANELEFAKLIQPEGMPIANELKFAKLTQPEGIPIASLSPAAKRRMPTEIVFAKTGGGFVDFNIVLSFTDKGEPQQKISTISGKSTQLAVKPDKPVKRVKGYIVFKSKRSQPTSFELPLNSLLASVIFANPVLANTQEKPVEIEEELVLQEFEYTDSDGDGIYTADIQVPVVAGDYEIITVMEFKDLKLGKKEIRLITVVDPEGYVYEKDGGREIRIPGAIVSLFWLNSETKQYKIWPAKKYQQENPQITDISGTYSFLVPEGYYYLKVETPGYPIYNSKPFQVKEGSGVHVNIELKTEYWWLAAVDWKTVLLAIIIVLLLYHFYRDRIKERLLRKKYL